MRLTVMLLGVLTLSTTGCDADCDNPSRLNGAYAVWSNAAEGGYTFTGTDNPQQTQQILDSTFVNGWSEWEFKHIPSKGLFQLHIDGQPYYADYQQADDNCNTLTMNFSGTYLSDDSISHNFQWAGDVTYMGTHLTGTFTYKDAWQPPEGAEGSGNFDLPAGEFHANLAGDTGF